MDLDERLRARLRAASEGEPDGADDRSWERVARRVAAAGPGVLRTAHRRRIAVRVIAGLAVLAVPVAAWLVSRSPGGTPSLPPRAADLRPCAARPPPLPAEPLPGADGTRRLDLEQVGVVIAEEGAGVSLTEYSACRTVLSLARGRITVHARDLGGGQLRVRTTACDVVVHGTLFAVTLEGTAVDLEVAEGVVTIERDGDEIARVGSGERFVLRGSRRELEPLEAAAASRIRERAEAAPLVAAGGGQVGGARALLGGGTTGGALPGGALPSSPSSAPPEPVPQAALPEPAVPAEAAGAGESSPAPQSPPGARPSRPATARPGTDEAPAGEDALRRARELRASGDFDGAGRAFRAAGTGSGLVAEGAWLELVRMELGRGALAAAREALAERRLRFGDDTPLALEAAGLELRTEREADDGEAADRIAREIVRRWPATAQGGAARRWLDERHVE
ncbi:MAG: FecR domain-containing protein [Deltaproteobacteria bacterium]|nr:FecR domain-containing protein [Deltaproteobacteria bacterium]